MSAPPKTDPAQHAAPDSGARQEIAWLRGGAKKNGRWSGYAHLLVARLREMQREPEVIFWVFLFPLLLAFGLGIAFRSRPASVPNVAIAAGPGANAVLQLAQRSPHSLHASIVPEAEALDGFRHVGDPRSPPKLPVGEDRHAKPPLVFKHVQDRRVLLLAERLG